MHRNGLSPQGPSLQVGGDSGGLLSTVTAGVSAGPRDALTTLLALGEDPWNAKLAMLEEGMADESNFPELDGLPSKVLQPLGSIWEGVPRMEALSRHDPRVAAAAFKAMLTDRTVCGMLNLEPRSWVTSLPDGLRVTQDLILAGSGVRCLPDNLWVGGDLDVRGLTALRMWPRGLHVGGNILIMGTRLDADRPPADLEVGGHIFTGPRDREG